MAENIMISASEIADYLYCKRGWWLRLHKLLEVTPHMEQGALDHSSLSSTLSKFEKVKQVSSYVLLGLMVAIAVYLAYLVFFLE